MASLEVSDTVDGRSALASALRQGDAIVRHLHPGAPTNAIAFSPNGSTIATASSGGVFLWDAATGQAIGMLHHGDELVAALAYSNDGSLLASAGSGIGDTVLWDAASGQEIARLAGQPSTGLAFNRGGDILVAARVQGGLAFWDVNRRALAQAIPDDPGQSVTGITFTGQEDVEIAASYGGEIILAPLNATEPTSRLLPHPGVTAIASTADGGVLASGGTDGSIQLWDVATATPVGEALHLSEDVSELAFNREGTVLAAAGLSTGEVALWDVTTRRPLVAPLVNTEGVSGLTFSPDGSTLVTGVPEGTITLWDVRALTEGREVLLQQGPVSGLAINGDGSILVSVSSISPGRLIVWDPGTRSRIAEVTPPGRPTGAVDVGGTVVAVALTGGDVALWDVASRAFRNVRLPHNFDVTSVALSADGRVLVAGSLEDDEVTIWHLDAADPRPETLDMPSRAADLDLSSDGQLLAIAGLVKPAVRLWRLGSTAEFLGEVSHPPSVTSVSFSSDGQRLATGGADRVIYWDVANLAPLGIPISRPTSIVTGVELTPDASMIAVTGFRDLSVADTASGRLLGEQFLFADAVNTIAMSGDGVLVAAGTDNGVIQLRTLSLDGQKTRACAVANRELTEDEWRALVPGQNPATLCGH